MRNTLNVKKILEGEFDWYAIDREGFVAHLSTAGYGAVPVLVQRDIEDQLMLDDYFVHANEDREAIFVSGLGGKLGNLLDWFSMIRHRIFSYSSYRMSSDWFHMAKQGLFSYDFQHWDGPYEQITRACEPVKFTVFPEKISYTLQKVCFKEICFREYKFIRPEDYFIC